jgi:hypothetical protein
LESQKATFLHDTGGHLTLGNDSLYIASSDGTLSAITIAIASDSTDPPSDNELPVAIAGPDQVARDEINLDGSQSFDPDGAIVSYDWELRPRENGGVNATLKTYSQTAEFLEGATPEVPDMAPGFYDVILTVTDDFGNSAKDTLLLAVAEKCDTPPQPDALLDVKRFKIRKYKRWNWTTASLFATIELPPRLDDFHGKWINSEITIKLKFPNGKDLLLYDTNELKVKNYKRRLHIYK